MELSHILDKSIESGFLNRDDIVFLLKLDTSSDVQRLLDAADEVRRSCVGDEVHIRALVEFSNFCVRRCNYCGLRAPNTKVKRYRMLPEEIVSLAIELDRKGLKTVVLQSGEDPYYTSEMIAEVVREIRAQTNMAITLCVGERSYDDYKLWKDIGANRYLLRHETANRELYASLHPDGNFDNRMRCLGWLQNLGYQTGAGCMVGLPGQTVEHLADDIEFIRDFQPDMVGIGPYIPHPNTPLAGSRPGNLEMTLKMIALARIVTRDALIPATTAIGSIHELGREMALKAGADVVMTNYTPVEYRVHYEIYPNKRYVLEDSSECDLRLRSRIQSIGRTVSTGHGHSRKQR
ncbi:MAG: [FeFe] hydrogenase H-cluster radical SAM maturase HydE [Armatimonadetes bacterium]|nr:[FeFe] hydrogenase H-cluster radical SAM maturase HydE [Armatimonadota bacterium]